MHITLIFEKESKKFFVFVPAKNEPAVGSIYLAKELFADGPPKSITLPIPQPT